MNRRAPSVSIRTALVFAMLAIALVPAVLISVTGVSSINSSVRREAQARVNQDLAIVQTGYRERLNRLALGLQAASSRIDLAAGHPAESLTAIRRELDLTVLNLCDAEGRPLDGRPTDPRQRTLLEQDPVLRQALGGRSAWGTVRLDPDRLVLEGGPALRGAASIYSDAKADQAVIREALAWWIACPIVDGSGRVAALLYGGRLLNFDDVLVDGLRNTVFSQADQRARSRGTVTIFLHDVRIATNVLTREGARAIGTRVSEAVRSAVLDRGMSYYGEALVVDTWYLSAYAPLQDPTGQTIGMVYVGLQRAPYDELRDGLIARFLFTVGLVGLLAVGAALYIAGRITRPVRMLGHSASRLATGDWEHRIALPRTYQELEQLAAAYTDMQAAIHRRDLELRARNDDLSLSNEKLEKSNRNYMQTLGFVTHELKAPLAAMQMLIATMMDGYLGQVPEKMADMLSRVRRNCEELQDMVRDYLDLSRMERGELVARPGFTDLVKSVVEPAIDQTSVFFRSRNISVRVESPAEMPVVADSDLLRVALNNLLTNAAKYGREGGLARVTLRREVDQVHLSVWNEGEGFPPEESVHLFEKFFRLRNANTQRKRGSGVGLFTVSNVAELHHGRAWAESEPGVSAAFHLSFPCPPPDAPSAPVREEVQPAG